MSDRDRDEDEDEDGEDDTDRAIKLARYEAVSAVRDLIIVLNDPTTEKRDRIEAARALLEVAGCL